MCYSESFIYLLLTFTVSRYRTVGNRTIPWFVKQISTTIYFFKNTDIFLKQSQLHLYHEMYFNNRNAIQSISNWIEWGKCRVLILNTWCRHILTFALPVNLRFADVVETSRKHKWMIAQGYVRRNIALDLGTPISQTSMQ